MGHDDEVGAKYHYTVWREPVGSESEENSRERDQIDNEGEDEQRDVDVIEPSHLSLLPALGNREDRHSQHNEQKTVEGDEK